MDINIPAIGFFAHVWYIVTSPKIDVDGREETFSDVVSNKMQEKHFFFGAEVRIAEDF